MEEKEETLGTDGQERSRGELRAGVAEGLARKGPRERKRILAAETRTLTWLSEEKAPASHCDQMRRLVAPQRRS